MPVGGGGENNGVSRRFWVFAIAPVESARMIIAVAG